MGTFTKETYQMLKINLKNILIFDLLYRLVTGLVFLQILNYGVRFSLKMAGYSYLTMENLGAFLLQPWTILAVFIIGVIGSVIVMVETGGLISAYSAAAYSQRMNPMDILLGGLRNTADELRRKNIKLIGIIIANFLLLHLFFIYRVLAHVKPFNFIMKLAMEEPWARLLTGAAACGLIAAAIPAIFAIHGCMIEQKSFQDSLSRSRDLLKGRYRKTIYRLVTGHALVIVTVVILYLLWVVLAAVLVILMVQKELELAFLMETIRQIEWVFLFLGAIAAWTLHIAAVTVQYYQSNNRIKREPRWNFDIAGGKAYGGRQMVAALAAIVCFSVLCLFDTAYHGKFVTRSMMVNTKITAHRGSSMAAPENTMAALEAAVEEMADWAEIDVQETQDGIVVLNHDNTLKRVAGLNKRVADMTYEQLSVLDVGSWFSPEYLGETMPTLEQAMEYAKGKIDLNIEIKHSGSDSRLPQKVLALVNQYEMQEQCVITSVNLGYLRQIKELQPEIKTGYILSAAFGDYYSHEAIDFISIRSSFVTEAMMKRSHEAGKAVHVWTVNTRTELERVKLLGVDNIITDNPVLAREVLYQEDGTENLLGYLRILLKE